MRKKIMFISSVFLTPVLIIILFLSQYLNIYPSKNYIRYLEDNRSLFSSTQNVENCKNNPLYVNDLKTDKDEIQQKIPLKIYPGGNPVGVKVASNGIIIVGYSKVCIDGQKEESPAKENGLLIGDVILKVNGIEVENSLDLVKELKENKNDIVELKILRDGKIIKKNIKLLKEENEYKIGLWIRDSTAGVGTMTFLDKDMKLYGALGHPITDCDTNQRFTIKKGVLLDSSIISVRRSEKGSPGELRGVFVDEETPKGNIEKNTLSGIFGKIEDENQFKNENTLMDVGYKEDIKEGSAEIITTIDEYGPKRYTIEIEKVLNQTEPGSKSMLIRVTDKRLLDKTGGIVQGMSGSPIIQNEKIVGAVTHVLVNKPEMGYGIYIEWMLREAGLI
ncbi:SpoIVB peptidase [Clostridium sp. BJN0001]|uniref:SpoIVB peptidase n=1 Tax=Clostridium sp. BJN0001 TaxID=2930219 RepID=UPI001FD17A7D|nr:SpoIVB peptidase [Clostridium sp. BJN0001]